MKNKNPSSLTLENIVMDKLKDMNSLDSLGKKSGLTLSKILKAQ